MNFKSMWKSTTAVSVLALVSACSGSSGGLAPGEGGDTNNVGNNTDSTGNNTDGSSGSSSGPGVDGTTPTVQEDPTENIPGVTTVEITGPPSGCEGSNARDVAFGLTPSAPVAQVEVRDGNLFANDTACTTADGTPIAVSDLRSFEVRGDANNNAVLLDLSSGDWTGVLTGTTGFLFDLKGGNNTVVVTLDDSSNTVYHGMLDTVPVLDLTGDGNVNLTAEGISRLGLNLGDGDDSATGLVEMWLAQSTEDPPELPNALSELTELSIPLLAFGGDGDDLITGGSEGDELGGGQGNDRLNGLAGSDVFTGSDAIDGTDILNGGIGFDVSLYSNRVKDLVLNLCVSTDLMGCNAGTCDCQPSGEVDEGDLLVNIEQINGGNGNDVLTGTAEAETLIGGRGDDTLMGMAGSDVLLGQLGLDILNGGLDDDVCDEQPSETPIDCEI